MPSQREEITAGTHMERMPHRNEGRGQCSIKKERAKIASRHIQRPGAEFQEEPELENEGFYCLSHPAGNTRPCSPRESCMSPCSAHREHQWVRAHAFCMGLLSRTEIYNTAASAVMQTWIRGVTRQGRFLILGLPIFS